MAVSSSNGSSRNVVEWALPGLVAGMMFAMLAMVVGIFASALWAPPQGIAQAIGIGPDGHEFHIVPFILGLMGHMMNSIILGAIFVAVVRAARPSPIVTVTGGVVYGLVVYARCTGSCSATSSHSGRRRACSPSSRPTRSGRGSSAT